MQAVSLLVTSIGLFFASLIEFYIAFILLKKDKGYLANQLLSLGFIILGVSFDVNIFNLLFDFSDSLIIDLHKLTNILAILFGIFLFATVSYIRFGPPGFTKINFILINIICFVGIVSNILYDGLLVEVFNSKAQVIWDTNYLIIACGPILLLGGAVIYFFGKLYLDLRSDKSISKQLVLSIVAYSMLLLTYFISRLPFYVIQFYPHLYTYFQLVGLLSSAGVILFSFLLARIFLQRKIVKN